MQQIPCVLMRGGTSKGPVFLAWDLPVAIAERDELLLNLMGSGHELEIDGIGGGSPQTSKVAILSPSLHADADVDYLFVQVMVAQRRVDTAPNCGNMLCAVGPFAIEEGLVKATEGKTLVRIRNLNTGTFVNSLVETPGGIVRYEGRTAIDGVPGTAAPVESVTSPVTDPILCAQSETPASAKTQPSFRDSIRKNIIKSATRLKGCPSESR